HGGQVIPFPDRGLQGGSIRRVLTAHNNLIFSVQLIRLMRGMIAICRQIDIYRLVDEIIDLQQDKVLLAQTVDPMFEAVAPFWCGIRLAKVPPTASWRPLRHLIPKLPRVSE